MDLPDGDLVRLARDGDPAAFRLLVERRSPTAWTDGELGGTFLRQGTGLDYWATAEDGRAILAASRARARARRIRLPRPGHRRRRLPRPHRHLPRRTAHRRGDGRSGLALRASSPGRSTPPRPASPDPRDDPGI